MRATSVEGSEPPQAAQCGRLPSQAAAAHARARAAWADRTHRP